MKRNTLLIILALLAFFIPRAQDDDPGKRGEKIQALKIAFITQKLSLTAEEAQRFWPVYGQYETDLKTTQGNYKNGDVIDNEEKLLNIRKKYRPEFTKVLGPVRMNKFFEAEKQFRDALLQRLKNRNSQQRPALRQR